MDFYTFLEKELKTYRVYVSNMLSYTLIKYYKPQDITNWKNDASLKSRRFQQVIGDAILAFQKEHAEDFKKLIAEHFFPSTENEINIICVEDCLLAVAGKLFRSENFAKEFFTFSSFLLQLGLHFVEKGEDKNISLIVESINYIYKYYLMRRIRVFGGWEQLTKYAVHYFIYSKRSINFNIVE